MLPRTKIIVYAIVVFVALIAIDQWRKYSSPSSIEDQIAPNHMEEASLVAADDWKEFSPANGKFKVLLPALPQHASDSVPLASGNGSIKYDMYLSQEKNGTTFMISLIEYPKDFDTSKSSDLLDSVMNQLMAGNPNNRLRNVAKGSYHTYPSLDFAIENNDVFVRSKTFMMGKTLFVLTLVDRNLNDIDAQFVKFINSFALQEVAVPTPESATHPTTHPEIPAPTSTQHAK